MLDTWGVHLHPIYMHCTRSQNNTYLVYGYLCSPHGVSICLLYICIVLDLERNLCNVLVCKASLLYRWGVHLNPIYMHCTRSQNNTYLVYWYLCSLPKGVHLPAIYIHCARSRKKTYVMYQYARHLCSIDGGSICIWFL